MWWSILGLLGGGLLGAAIFLTVDYFLSSDTLSDAVKEKEPDAFKVLIKEKKKKRSLDANSYFWLLCDKLAEKTRILETEQARIATLIENIRENIDVGRVYQVAKSSLVWPF